MTGTSSTIVQVSTPEMRRARDAKGLARERVAALIDPPISSKTLERWEQPGYPVPRWRAEQLAALYDVAVVQIIAEAA